MNRKRKNMRKRIRDASRKHVERGTIVGLRYGYKVDRQTVDAKGVPVPGRRKIDKERAKVVVRIFEAYAAGASGHQIAVALNNDGVPNSKGRPSSLSNEFDH